MHEIVNSILKVVFLKQEALGMACIKSGNEKFGGVMLKQAKQWTGY